MNSTSTSSNAAIAAATPHPIVRILALAARMYTAFPGVRLSVSWIQTWGREQVQMQEAAADGVRAIDDPLERSDVIARLEQIIAESTSNDSPTMRRQASETFAELKRAYAQIHEATEKTSERLRPHCPAELCKE